MEQKKPLDMQDNPFEEGQAVKTPQEETITLNVDGQDITLTMEQLVQAAVSGLSRRSEVIRMAGASSQVPDGQVYANFIASYPDVQPGDIPQEVWQDAQMEGSLVSAYRKYEIAQLKAKLAALEQNETNRRQAVGSAAGDGQPAQIDPVIAALRGE
ncbi:MAG: hypothetical protein ACI3XZ_05245 [Butyricicoccus sp.]